ncbi:hypothetical protein ACCO45_012783 [Purpureocillium lilacinum]|uniref:Uncharacterized protein n=1 Tax=Purpureocillium lilacinum TaxID=33203 RepID=A0ACC4D8Z2_PURLI
MIRGRKRPAEDDPPLADRSTPSSTVASVPAPQQPLRISKAPTGGPAAVSGMSDVLDYSPVPTLLISPSNRIQRASIALLEAWDCRRDQLVDRDLFISLYEGSPTERFDRIPLGYAIESAITARAVRLCHAAYVAGSVSWNARIIPLHRDEELLCLILEWEVTKVNVNVADDQVPWSRLPIDDTSRILFQAVKELAIFLLDTGGNVVTWKIGADLYKGYEKEELVGKHFSIFYSADDVQSHKPETALETSLRDGRAEDEGWRYGKDGTRFWADVVIIPVYNHGIHVGFGTVTRNLTETKEAELRLIAAYEETAKLKSDFLAIVSHEIRTPMHGMLSACALLLDSGLTDKQLEMANMIEESGCVLLQIINDILDYSKLAEYSLSINTGMIDVASVVASVDNVINQKVLVGMLRAFGFLHITVVSDGAQAVSVLSKTPNAFDLVLMDISMPVMNGYEATMQIRNGAMRLPILAMTAYALKGDMERCLENGFDDYIAKPVHIQLLMRKLLKWLIKPCDSGHQQAR